MSTFCLRSSRVLAALLLGSALAEAREITFEERVRAQEAIERVYYRHQIGATQAFEEVVPRAVIERKVRRYLDQSTALERIWRTPITGPMLDREAERIAAGTRMPERLVELHAALGNDPILIKECLVRAVLADRLARGFFAFDDSLQAPARSEARQLLEGLRTGAIRPSAPSERRTVTVFTRESEGGREGQPEVDARDVSRVALDPVAFEAMRSKLPPSAGDVGEVRESRDGFTISVILEARSSEVWVASYFAPKITWDEYGAAYGERSGPSPTAVVATGEPLPTAVGEGSPAAPAGTDVWDNGVLDDMPNPRRNHTAVWTGTVMIVWGGGGSSVFDDVLRSGARYDPATDTWADVTRVGAPAARALHTAVAPRHLRSRPRR